ncbi:TPA: hypothetical protein ACX448_004018 [Klebsiella pneumoniae]
MLAEFSAAMAAIKETAALAKLITDAKTESEVNAAVSDLVSKLTSVQRECISLVELARSLQEEAVTLKAKIAEFENFNIQSESYALYKMESGTLVYSTQVTHNGVQFTVNACPHCFHQKKISILQPGTEKGFRGGYWIHFCPSCKSDFTMDQTPAAKNPAGVVRRLPGGQAW